MMKCIGLLLVVISVAAAIDGKKCKSAEDCDEGQCCVNYVLTSFFGGHCRPMRLEGESCTPLEKDSPENPDMYHFQCPCKAGLECVAKHEIKIFGHIIRHRPECVVPGDEDVTDETPFPDPDLE